MFVHSVQIVEYRLHTENMSRDSVQMLESGLATLRAQRAWVAGNDVLRAAYRRGVARCREYYGERVARDLTSEIRRRNWGAAGREAWVLARRYPRGLAHAIGSSRLREYLRTLRAGWSDPRRGADSQG
jgi:hypothetical protein